MNGERVDEKEGDGESEGEGAVPGPVLPTRFTLYLAWMAIRAAPALKGVHVREGERTGGGGRGKIRRRIGEEGKGKTGSEKDFQ